MRHIKKRSFDLLSKYDNFLPSTREIIVLMLMLVAGIGLGSAVMLLLTATLGADFSITYGTVITYPFQFLPAIWYASAKCRLSSVFQPSEHPIDDSRFIPLGVFAVVAGSILATWTCIIVTEPTQLLLPEMPTRLKLIMDRLTKGPLWVSLLSTAVLAPFFEEWLCRGMILRSLLTRIKPIWAIVISAAIFGAIHMNLWQALNAFFLGCLFGLIYYRTGSLKLVMLMHAVANATSVFLSRIPDTDDIEYLWQLVGDARIYDAIYFVSLLLLAYLVVRFIRIEFVRNPEEA